MTPGEQGGGPDGNAKDRVPAGDGGFVIGGGPARPVLPFAPDGDDDEEPDEDQEEALVATGTDNRRSAQSAVADFTRNIQRKKDKEMADLQFVGGSGTATEKKQAISDKKAGRNDPCPCGSGKKYKKCHGA